MPRTTSHPRIAVAGIDIGKNTCHVVGHDKSGAIVPGPQAHRPPTHRSADAVGASPAGLVEAGRRSSPCQDCEA
jgi:hypothetical protein